MKQWPKTQITESVALLHVVFTTLDSCHFLFTNMTAPKAVTNINNFFTAHHPSTRTNWFRGRTWT